MRFIHCAALTIFSITGLAVPAIAQDESELLRLEKVWNDAHLSGNVAALDSLWTEDITIIVPTMRPMAKEESLRFWREVPVRFTQYESTDVSTRMVAGESAIVTGRLRRTRQFGQRTASDDWQFTKVYVRQNDAWRVVSFHASQAPE